MRTLGLIGGLSWESSALYYRSLNEGVRARLGGVHSAPLIVWSFDFAPLSVAQHEGRWDDIAAVLSDAARRLERAGADGVILCTNTMHLVADEIQGALSVPFLHIADAVIDHARSLGIRRLGLLGTRFTMEAPFLKDRFAQEGLEILTPGQTARAEIHGVIYDELCVGEVRDQSRATYLQVIEDLRRQGAEGVILGCTEIGMLIRQGDTPVPLLDTTTLHALKAIDFICGSASAPDRANDQG